MKEKMKEKMFFEECFRNPQNPPDESAQNVAKNFLGLIIPLFFLRKFRI